ncbi:MAG: FAD-dependent oxidoreductase [Vicinamibacterales bacterium]|nr:FAD-dependent oxidoreductase [Vicinamibacterales bacterium]
MNRRAALKSGTTAALGLVLGGCATRPAATVAPVRAARPMVRLPRVHASLERVIRTTVGLRPYRPSGFVLRAERLDDTTLVHNYGHGGAGWSLSWGTGLMATELALETGHRRAVVIGAGVVGLTTALQLQRRGVDVTIYAASLPPETTSNMALAGFTPTSGLVNFATRSPAWEAQFRRAVTIAYRHWQLLVGPHWGVSWVPNYAPTDTAGSAAGANPLLPDEVRAARELLGPGEHPFPMTYAVRRDEMRFEPSIFLDAALRDFLVLGGRVVVRRFASLREVAALGAPVVVNCAGLGARDLVGDQELTPLRGQLVVLVPQPEVQYATNGGVRTDRNTPGGFLHMMPRSDGIILGGTSEEGEWSLEPDPAEIRRVVERHVELFDSMR